MRFGRLTSSSRRRANDLLRRTGCEVRRSDAFRRVRLLNRVGVDLVLDVGAATGIYARDLRTYGYGGRIVSFEPLPLAYTELVGRSRGDELWTTERVALGSNAGSAVINVAANSDSSSLLPMLDRHRSSAPHANYVSATTVPVRRLDSYAHVVGDAAHPFLKVDVQGFEREVLDGASEVLDQMVGVQIEISFVPLYEGGMLHLELLSRMDEMGVTLVGLEPGFRDPSTGHLLQADGLFLRTTPE